VDGEAKTWQKETFPNGFVSDCISLFPTAAAQVAHVLFNPFINGLRAAGLHRLISADNFFLLLNCAAYNRPRLTYRRSFL